MKKFLLAALFISSIAFGAGEFRMPKGGISTGSFSIGRGSVADSKSILELYSTTKGFLPPRMTTTQRDAISSPTTGLTIFNSTTSKMNVYDGTSWKEVGSGSGAGGINFIGMDSTWTNVYQADIDFETSIGQWLAFADAAASTPVDMVGGSPNTTCARTTTGGEYLNGSASMKITKGAANRQGEGCSVYFYVPQAYRGQTVTISFPYYVVSGSMVSGDIKTFIYDVATSSIITPYNNDVIGARGRHVSTFSIPTGSDQMRFGIYFASTSTTAVTLTVDDVKIEPGIAAYGMAASDPISFTPTGSWSTNTTYTGTWQRIGNMMLVNVDITLAGAPTSASLTVNLPSGYTIDTTAWPANFPSTNGVYVGRGKARDAGVNNYELGIGYNSSTSVVLSYGDDAASGVTQSGVTQANPFTFGASDAVTLQFMVPISGWSSNVQMAQSSSFYMSNYLANGSRVTGSAPTELGQYRSYLRNAGASTFTETNGNPTTTPTAADGVKIYTGNAYTAADTNNQPTRYDIFVGKNKNVRVEFFASTGKTGAFDGEKVWQDSAIDYGYLTSYDSATGILYITGMRQRGGAIVHGAGVQPTAIGTALTSGYFDIKVSENALGVGFQNPRCYIRLTDSNGLGGTVSGDTAIRNLTTVQQSAGNCYTRTARTTTTADFYTINEDGNYCLSRSGDTDSAGSDNRQIGFSLNSAQTSTAVGSITTASRLAVAGHNGTFSTGTYLSTSWCGYLGAGSVIRLHDNTAAPADGAIETFTLSKVSH